MGSGIFLGRERSLEQMLAALDRVLSRREAQALPQVVLISGQGGIGKSTLLLEFQERLGWERRNRLQILHIDWQNEKQLNPAAFSVPPDQLDARILFQAFERAAKAQIERWEKFQKAYRQADARIQAAHDAVVQAAGSLSLQDSDRPGKAGQQDLLAETVSGAISTLAGPLSNAVQPVLTRLARFGIRIAPQILEKVRGKLKEGQWDLLLAPEAALAAGFAESLAEAAEERLILVTFDTYELVDELDGVVRAILQAAGSRVAWVIAGRHNLYETRIRPPRGRINGYREEDRHGHEATVLDLKALAREEIREYFRLCAPERPELSSEEVERIDEATWAIPLAVKLAAELWKATGDLTRIVSSENAAVDTIVRQVVERYTQYCIHDERDRRVLVALAMADGDLDVLQAMLLPEFGGSDEDFRHHLDLVRHRYEAVQQEGSGLRLHEEPARFFRQLYQLEEERQRTWVRSFNQRAVERLFERIARLLEYHSTLEELCEDAEYVQAATQAAHFLLWLDPIRAIPWVSLRYTEGLAFSAALGEGLCGIVRAWHEQLDSKWVKRLNVLENAFHHSYRPEALEDLRRLLETDARRGWLRDTEVPDRYSLEREVIRRWVSARAFLRNGRLTEALEILQRAAGAAGEALGTKIAAAASELCYELWRKRDRKLITEAADLAVALDPESVQTLIMAGASFNFGRNYDRAESSLLKALELEPASASIFEYLGNVAGWRNQYDKAEQYHRKALELDPNNASAWRELGNDYFWRDEYDKAEECHRKALELDPKDAAAWRELGNDYSRRSQYDKAEEYIRKAMELDPSEAETRIRLGYLLMIRGDCSSAEQAFEAAIVADSTEPNSFYLMACMMYRRGLLEEAFAWAQKGVDRTSSETYPEIVLLGLASILEAPLDPSLWERTRLKVEGGGNLLIQAEWLSLEGKAEEALAALALAIEQAPNNVVYARFRPAFHFLRRDPRFWDLTREAPGSTWQDLGPEPGEGR